MREGVVLIIDNDKKMARDLQEFFFNMKHEALPVFDKAEALNSIGAIGFDLIILEINIPEGIEILKYIKEKQPKTKVVIFSNCDYKTKKEAEEIGSVEFLPKKVEMSMLLEVLNFVMGR